MTNLVPVVPLQFFLFGPAQVLLHGQPLTHYLSRKAQALLYYLATTQQTQSRSRLAALFWPDIPDAQARKNLRNILPELRRYLEDYLYIDTEVVGLRPDRKFVADLHLVAKEFKHERIRENPSLLLETAALYRGEFLEGFFLADALLFEEWMLVQREHYHQLVVDGLYQAAQVLLTRRDSNVGMQIAKRLLEIDRLHEAAHRLIMHFLWLDGQRPAAMSYYHQLQMLLQKELAVEPDEATRQLFEEIRASSADILQPQRMLHESAANNTTHIRNEIPHNLPNQLTGFIGRKNEVEAICKKLMDPNCQWLTLFGEGGIGKTRMALAVAHAIVDGRGEIKFVQSSNVDLASQEVTQTVCRSTQFCDGIWFISYSGVTVAGDLAEQLAITIAQAIQFQFAGKQPLLAQLLGYLRDKVLLIIIDSAEHLLPDIAEFLIKILQNSPCVKILVTSRHLFNLQAEFVWRVTGLPVPSVESQKRLTQSELMAFNSVALFVERARRINRSFQITPQNQEEIAQICRLVEGLPLAIELAAALTKQRTCGEILTALQEDPTALTVNLADLPIQHRSMKSVLDYSWQFLNADEAMALAACSIFSEGFTFGAAASILNASEATLIKLADQSLLQLHEGRFAMHELVRQYAAAQLAQTSEQKKVIATRHAAYYLALLRGLEGALVTEYKAQQAVQTELNNIRTAWLYGVEQGKLELLASAVDGLECYYRLTGIYREAIYLLKHALIVVRQAAATVPAEPQAQHLLVRLLCHMTQFYRRSGEVAQGERLVNEALTLGLQLNEPALLGLIYHESARLAQIRGDFVAMRRLAEQSCTYARTAAAIPLIAESLNDVGVAVSFSINPLAAQPYFLEALQCLQTVTNRYLEGRLLDNLGGIYLLEHEYKLAYRYLQQAVDLKRQLHDQANLVIALIFWGDLWRALGVYDASQQSYQEAEKYFETVRDPYWESWLYANFGHLQTLRGDPNTASTLCLRAQKIAQQSGTPLHKQWATVYLGHAFVRAGDSRAAKYCYQEALDLSKQSNWTSRTTDAHAGLAVILLAENDLSAALAHAEAALTILAEEGLSVASEPFQVYWNCIRVLEANHDLRVKEVLRTAYRSLQRIANELEDFMLRYSFLENVVANRNLVAMARAAGIQ